MQNNSLILIDAYSQIFRSFYAIRMLTNSRGEAVNAAFVFTKLLMQLEKNHPSKYGAMLFDCGKVEFRLKLNPDYKANRPPMPDPLKSQIPLIRRIAEAFGWELMQCEGFEADDLIGGMAKKYDDCRVSIVSSDKDLSQLIDDRVTMLIPGSGGFDLRDAAAVENKFGVRPEQMVDYLALLGDNSDNIPGVPGIGPKSAVEIIRTLGDVEQWINAPETLDADNKYVKKLLPHLELLQRNRELIRLRTELPGTFCSDLPPVRREPDWAEIWRICEDNQFKSLLKELPELPEKIEKQLSFIAQDEDDLFTFAARCDMVDVSQEAPENEKNEIQGELF